MNFVSKSLLSVATLVLAGQVFAAQSQPECLPASVIANTVFTKAMNDPTSPQANVWAMISDNFSYQNSEWNVIFGAVLDNAHSSSEALEQGQNYFKTISIEEGQPLVFGQQIFCQYGSMDNEYVIFAASPPLDVSQSMSVARKIK